MSDTTEPKRKRKWGMRDTTEPTRKRLIEFPERLWEALDRDAKRSRRSSMKQLQVLVENVYWLGDTEIRDLGSVREALGVSAQIGPIQPGMRPRPHGHVQTPPQ